MAKALRHYGYKFWWNGRVKTMCGQVWEPGESRSPFFISPLCPACERLEAERKERQRR